MADEKKMLCKQIEVFVVLEYGSDGSVKRTKSCGVIWVPIATETPFQVGGTHIQFVNTSAAPEIR